jgi:hypothetical protein
LIARHIGIGRSKTFDQSVDALADSLSDRLRHNPAHDLDDTLAEGDAATLRGAKARRHAPGSKPRGLIFCRSVSFMWSSRCRSGCWGALFRRLFLTRLLDLHDAGKLAFFGKLTGLSDRRTFQRHLALVRKKRWVVYAKAPFAEPQAVLAYLSRYTHRVAISNSRLITFDGTAVTFRYKDYRRAGTDRQQVMTLFADEFIRRFLLHTLPRGFHRIPALRSARRLCPQGLPSPGPRLAGGGAGEGRTAGRGDRLRPAPALSLLRRHHGDHRDLRALVPATGAADRTSCNPGDRS